MFQLDLATKHGRLRDSRLAEERFASGDLQSRPKVVGTLELHHVSPFPPNQCWKISRFFSNKKGKNHRIINIGSGGRGELASCPSVFVWDCREKKTKTKTKTKKTKVDYKPRSAHSRVVKTKK